MGYKKVKITKCLNHLDGKWCKIDTKTLKQMKPSYYEKWNEEDCITLFGKRLNYEKSYVDGVKIVTTDQDKLQFYIEHIYNSATFKKE